VGVIESAKDMLAKGPKGPPVPPTVDARIRRGRDAMLRDQPRRRLAHKFWNNEQFHYRNEAGQLRWLDTVTGQGAGKPAHRIRKQLNFIRPIVEGKVSAATQRVPGFEVTPSSTDPEDVAAARLSQQVAFYGFDQWRMRRAATKAVTLALVQREAFAFPYFDPNHGPFTPVTDEQGSVEWVGQGEIKIRVFSRNQVTWEPGVDFDDSRWFTLEEARPVDEVEKLDGFAGGKLVPDANTSDNPTEKSAEAKNLVLVTEYLERPCRDYPVGRRLTIANGRVILPEEPYPLQGPDGEALDEPVLHRLSYTVNPEGDDLGLVELLIDPQQTINDCWSKLLEWKNRCLNPQMLAPIGSLDGLPRPDDTPGAIKYYRPVGGQVPTWEKAPPVPQELMQMLQSGIEFMRAIASDVDIQAEPDVAAKSMQQAVETSRQRWQSFLGDYAEFMSRLMRSCLTLCARHYSEERIIQIRGQYGWEPVPAFTGQDLRGQVNVRVSPGTLEVKSKASVMNEVQWLVTMYPGAISPQAAMAAIHGGSAEGLLRSYELDVARANELVQKIRTVGIGLLAEPMGPPTMTNPEGTPAWMPRPQDNPEVWKQVVGDYMKTPDFSAQPFEVQEMFNLVWDALIFNEQQEAMKQAMQQQQMAEGLGMANAAAPQLPAAMPDQKAIAPGGEG
jgi:hypothetical protein